MKELERRELGNPRRVVFNWLGSFSIASNRTNML